MFNLLGENLIPINIFKRPPNYGKTAIEIPEDCAGGLKRAAKDEDGDLSSFVLEAMQGV